MDLIEGICYLNPVYPELLADHPTMRGVWCKCASLIKNGAMMAPLLVDDRPLREAICHQTVESLLHKTTGRSFKDFPWFAPKISESGILAKYPSMHCPTLYLHYNMQVLRLLRCRGVEDWTWTKIHPLHFQNVNGETLLRLWEWLDEVVETNLNTGKVEDPENEILSEDIWGDPNTFFSRFRHYWVAENGQTVSHTRPVWHQGKVLHEPIP